MEYSEVDPKGILCVYGDTKDGSDAQEGDEVFMCVGVVMEKPMPDRFKGRFDVFRYEASTWLVFPVMDNAGTKENTLPSSQQGYARITEWMPTSVYESTDAPTMEWTESYDFSKPDRKSEIWVPVRKR